MNLSSATDVVRRCADSADADAWAEFTRRFQPLIRTVVQRCARHWGVNSEHQIQELVQDAYLKLLADDRRILREVKLASDETVFAFLKAVTANLVYDHFRALNAEKREGSRAMITGEELESVASDDSARLEREMLIHEIDGILKNDLSGAQASRDRRIFWLKHRQGLSARAIASLPGMELSTKGVESVLQRLRELVREKYTDRKESSSGNRNSR